MSTIVESNSSYSDSDFENYLAEAKRRSILEIVKQRSNADKVILAEYSSAMCL